MAPYYIGRPQEEEEEEEEGKKLQGKNIMAPLLHRAAITRMWANAQRDGRPAKHRWRPLFNAAVWLTPTT